MNLEEKYQKLKELFYHNFIVTTNSDMQGNFIPAERIRIKREEWKETGLSEEVIVGDGTINIASYLQFLYLREKNGEDVKREIKETLMSLTRLPSECYNYFKTNNPNIYIEYENGFFLRDDIKKEMYPLFHTKRIRSAWTSGIERENEDPCFSPFVSQDQIWNLLPILSVMIEKDDESNYTIADYFLNNILHYVIKNNHTIYNPYYSALLHNWTYLNLDVPYGERIKERNRKLKYRVKVKRGANNWYYAYGFRKTFDRFNEVKCSRFKTLLYSLIYYPLTFGAEKIYFPLLRRFFGIKGKDNAYHCLGVSGEVWWGGEKNFTNHVIKEFNKSGAYENIVFLEALKRGKEKTISLEKLEELLLSYPDPDSLDGNVESPISFLILYNAYKYLKAL